MSLDKIEKICYLYNQLKNIAKETNDSYLLECIVNRKYYKTTQPIRGKLNRYIDLSKDYERKNNKKFIVEDFMEENFVKINTKNCLEEENTYICKEIEKINREYNEIIITIDEIIKRSGMNKVNDDDLEILL